VIEKSQVNGTTDCEEDILEKETKGKQLIGGNWGVKS